MKETYYDKFDLRVKNSCKMETSCLLSQPECVVLCCIVSMFKPELGVNIDHAATLRNVRGTSYPNLVLISNLAVEGGADFVTLHLREDRRHVVDSDLLAIKRGVSVPMNLEVAAVSEMLGVISEILPNLVTVVPEKRMELTTEGGLDLLSSGHGLHEFIHKVKSFGVRVSVFVDPDPEQVERAAGIGVDAVELHTGALERHGTIDDLVFEKLVACSSAASRLNIPCYAGHGLTFKGVGAVSRIPGILGINVGHFAICNALLDGICETVRKIKRAMNGEIIVEMEEEKASRSN